MDVSVTPLMFAVISFILIAISSIFIVISSISSVMSWTFVESSMVFFLFH